MGSARQFDIFLCHKKSSGKDFADHLKAGLEELGYHTFLDSKDIPKAVDGVEEWIEIRDRALAESKVFILLITPGFDLSPEVIKEIGFARAVPHKKFVYFRHRDLSRKIVLNLETEKVDLGRQEQVSFESKEELLRLANGILLQNKELFSAKPEQTIANEMLKGKIAVQQDSAIDICAMCSKRIACPPIIVTLDNKIYNFDSWECAKTFKKLHSIYGQNFP
jgi:hypothetical protein